MFHFSNGNSGASTLVTQSLTFLGEESGLVEKCNKCQDVSSLMFGHDHKRRDEAADEEMVKELLGTLENVVDSEVPRIFSTLVYSLRNLKHSVIKRIYHGISNKRTKKFFEDALPLLKTDSGVLLMRDIIIDGQLPESTVDSWFSYLALYRNPSKLMLSTLSVFIDTSARHSALLGISSLTSTFCSSQSSCSSVTEVKHIIQRLELLLGNSCHVNSTEERDRMILTLKGLRNVGILLGSKNVLNRCIQDKSNFEDVRVTALETAKGEMCKSPKHNSILFSVLEDKQEDSEIRISAYLALMECPSDKTVEKVKNLLHQEEVNQGNSNFLI